MNILGHLGYGSVFGIVEYRFGCSISDNKERIGV